MAGQPADVKFSAALYWMRHQTILSHDDCHPGRLGTGDDHCVTWDLTEAGMSDAIKVPGGPNLTRCSLLLSFFPLIREALVQNMANC